MRRRMNGGMRRCLANFAAAAAVHVLLGVSAAAQSAWLPAPGRLSFTSFYTYQNSHRMFRGARLVPYRDRYQRTGGVYAEYGITSRLAVDVSLGAGQASFGLTPDRTAGGGLTDTNVGVRLKLLSEQNYRFLPTIAIRAGGTVAGNYTPGLSHSIGDGASGAEFSILLGKALADGRMGLLADAGLRKRNGVVPDDWFGSAAIYRSFLGFTWSAGLRHTHALTGPSIGDRGWTRQNIREISQMAEIGVGRGGGQGRYYQLFAARQTLGRNSPDKLVVGVAFTFSFRPAKLLSRDSP